MTENPLAEGIILRPDPIKAYSKICEDPLSILDIDKRLINEEKIDRFYSVITRILGIKDHEIKAYAVKRWYDALKHHLGYYVREEDYKKTGSLEMHDIFCKRGSEDIDDTRKDLFARVETDLISRLRL